jgi:holin-like protein
VKIIKQTGILFTIAWAGELVRFFLPFNFPAGIIGLIILLVLLLSGLLRLENIQELSNFLLANMSFFFIPAGVNAINYFNLLGNAAIQLILICVISTIVTFAVTAFSVSLAMKLLHRAENA